MTRKRRYWRIEGYESLKPIYEVEVPVGRYSEQDIENLLRALVSRAGLTFREIVESYARHNARRNNGLLEVQRDTGPNKFTLSCGSNPYFYASIVEKMTSNRAIDSDARKRHALPGARHRGRYTAKGRV
jgi:hypothetical protein